MVWYFYYQVLAMEPDFLSISTFTYPSYSCYFSFSFFCHLINLWVKWFCIICCYFDSSTLLFIGTHQISTTHIDNDLKLDCSKSICYWRLLKSPHEFQFQQYAIDLKNQMCSVYMSRLITSNVKWNWILLVLNTLKFKEYSKFPVLTFEIPRNYHNKTFTLFYDERLESRKQRIF